MTTFLDTGVLIALLDSSHQYHAWSVNELQNCQARGPVIISDIVYCEFSIGMKTQADVDETISTLGLERFSWRDDVLFRAGRAFKKYRENLGPKLGVLPDFLIGAVAEVRKSPLVTINQRDFVSYFPGLKIICP